MLIGDTFWEFDSNELEHSLLTKEELLKMPVGTKITTNAKKDNEYIYDGEDFFNTEYCIEDTEINDDLTLDTLNEKYGTRIVKIEKPTGYETIYEYSNEVQEMTIAEIEKALGHAVKIIKEEE